MPEPILTDKSEVVTYNLNGIITEYPKSKLNPLRAIRFKCIDCNGGIVSGELGVENCVVPDCPLYPFRMGKGFKRNLSDEQRAKLSERAKLRFGKATEMASGLIRIKKNVSRMK